MRFIIENVLFIFLAFNNCEIDNIIVNEIDTITSKCHSNTTISMNMEKGYAKRVVSYEEGKIETYTYSDSSYLVVHCGMMQKLPFLSGDKYEVSDSIQDDKKISRSGINKLTNRFWREDNYKGKFTIIYGGVDVKQRDRFDHFIDNVKILED